MKQIDKIMVDELVLYICDDDQLYVQLHSPIQDSLQKRWDKGTYDFEKSVKAYQYLADAGAQKYHKEFGSNDQPWHKMFTKAEREATARILAGYWKTETEIIEEMKDCRRLIKQQQTK